MSVSRGWKQIICPCVLAFGVTVEEVHLVTTSSLRCFQRLFFLNGDTDLSAFLVVDLGLVTYPRYKCWREQNIFDSREALLAYEQVYYTHSVYGPVMFAPVKGW